MSAAPLLDPELRDHPAAALSLFREWQLLIHDLEAACTHFSRHPQEGVHTQLADPAPLTPDEAAAYCTTDLMLRWCIARAVANGLFCRTNPQANVEEVARRVDQQLQGAASELLEGDVALVAPGQTSLALEPTEAERAVLESFRDGKAAWAEHAAMRQRHRQLRNQRLRALYRAVKADTTGLWTARTVHGFADQQPNAFFAQHLHILHGTADNAAQLGLLEFLLQTRQCILALRAPVLGSLALHCPSKVAEALRCPTASVQALRLFHFLFWSAATETPFPVVEKGHKVTLALPFTAPQGSSTAERIGLAHRWFADHLRETGSLPVVYEGARNLCVRWDPKIEAFVSPGHEAVLSFARLALNIQRFEAHTKA